jgi:hypothetical protein
MPDTAPSRGRRHRSPLKTARSTLPLPPLDAVVSADSHDALAQDEMRASELAASSLLARVEEQAPAGAP